MLRPRNVFIALGGVGLAALLGCGGGSPPPAPVSPAPAQASNLSGNWLLAGVLPARTSLLAPTGAFGLAVTFDVTGNQVFGALSFESTCAGVPSGGGLAVVSGTVAADGSFTLTTPSSATLSPLTTVTVNGTVPGSANDVWTGSYSIMNASSSPCPGTVTGSIAAASIPLVSGKYTGQTTAGFASAATPVTVSATLQQGGTVDVPPSGKSVTSNLNLSGTVSLQAGSCSSSGTTSGATAVSAVEGNDIALTFLMNDGKTLQAIGTVSALDASQLTLEFVTLEPQNCFSTPVPDVTLSR